MFKTASGHVNPAHVAHIGNITELSVSGRTNKEYRYEIDTIGARSYFSETFTTYDEAVKNRGILLRIISPKPAKQRQHLQENS